MTAIYTLWARFPNDEGAWMIAAEDEWCWEGNPARCKAKFEAARDQAERDGNIVREVVLHIDQEQIEAAFNPAEVQARVAAQESAERTEET